MRYAGMLVCHNYNTLGRSNTTFLEKISAYGTKAEQKNVYVRKIPTKPDKCSTCDKVYQNIQILHGKMVKHICECNYHLLEEASAGFLKRKKLKRILKGFKPGTVRTIELNI